MRLGQPHGIANLGLEALLLKMAQGLGHRLRGKEQVQVLGVAPDSRMFLQSERSCHHVRDVGAIQVLEHFAEQGPLLRRKFRRG